MNFLCFNKLQKHKEEALTEEINGVRYVTSFPEIYVENLTSLCNLRRR